MKQIQPVSIWDNGQTKQATILNCYGIRTIYGVEQENYYSLFSQNENGSVGEIVAQGNLTIRGEAYQQWGLDDSYVWEWVAQQLNLTIIGDYVEPVAPIIEEAVAVPIVEEPIVE